MTFQPPYLPVDVPPEKLERIRLDQGMHKNPQEGLCFMEAASLFAGDGFTDIPSCADQLLTRICQMVNDNVDDRRRQQLVPLIPRVLNTDTSWKEEQATSLDQSKAYSLFRFRKYLTFTFRLVSHFESYIDPAEDMTMFLKMQELWNTGKILELRDLTDRIQDMEYPDWSDMLYFSYRQAVAVNEYLKNSVKLSVAYYVPTTLAGRDSIIKKQPVQFLTAVFDIFDEVFGRRVQ